MNIENTKKLLVDWLDCILRNIYDYQVVASVIPSNEITQKGRLRRIAEIQAGRSAIIEATTNLGVSITERFENSGGRPYWPPGIIGSLSHSGDIVIVLVMRCSTQTIAVGLDIENAIHATNYYPILEDKKKLQQYCLYEAYYKALSYLPGNERLAYNASSLEDILNKDIFDSPIGTRIQIAKTEKVNSFSVAVVVLGQEYS